MNSSERDEWLQEWLKKEPYLDDNGFTQNVLDALPKSSGRNRFRTPILLVSFALAALALWIQLPRIEMGLGSSLHNLGAFLAENGVMVSLLLAGVVFVSAFLMLAEDSQEIL